MAKVDCDELARQVIVLVGGEKNITSAMNCMTRLRISVSDDAKIDVETLEATGGVLGVIHNQPGYVEVVVGPGKSSRCMKVFRELGIAGAGEMPPSDSSPAGSSLGQATPAGSSPEQSAPAELKSLVKTFGRIFAPMIPGIIASGLCAGLASIIRQLVPGYSEILPLGVAVELLNGIYGSLMTVLAAWTGYRTAEVMGGTPILGGMVGMISTMEVINVISRAVGLYNEAQPLDAVLRTGRGGVLAVILGVWLMGRIENSVRRNLPDALDTVFTPLLTLFFTLIPYIFVIMPLIGFISKGICFLVEIVSLNPSPFVRAAAGYVSAGIFLPMVAMGMHHGLIAIYTVQLETFGYVTLYPALAMAGFGQVGAALALRKKALRIGNTSLVRAIDGGLPAGILGVGEPLIYGVTLPLGRPLITAGLGAGFGGAFVMLMRVASTVWGPSGIPGIFVMTEGPLGAAMSMTCYAAGLVISAVMGYVITAAGVRDEAVK